MRNLYLISIGLFVCFGCSEQHRIQKRSNALSKCENEWEYFKIDKPIKGIVLLHTKGYCGYSNIHSNTIVILNGKDTIRVDGPCTTENVSVSDSVIVRPYYDSDNVKGAIGDLRYDCTIRKTCRGVVSKLK